MLQSVTIKKIFVTSFLYIILDITINESYSLHNVRELCFLYPIAYKKAIYRNRRLSTLNLKKSNYENNANIGIYF